MFGFRFWQALFEGKRWARRQLMEGIIVAALALLMAWVVKGQP